MDSGDVNKLVVARFISSDGVETNLDVELSSNKISYLRSKLSELKNTTNVLITKHVEATKAAANLQKQTENAKINNNKQEI